MQGLKRALYLILCLAVFALTSCGAKLEREVFLSGLEPVEKSPLETAPLTKEPETLWEKEPLTEPETEAELPATYCIERIEALNQYPHFPTGCEATAAVMLLRYWGIEMEIGDFVDHHLPLGEPFRMEGGRLYGPDPYKSFVGSPRDATSFGCMAPVIAAALKSATLGTMQILDLSGTETESLERYIAKDIPVILWVTMGMIETGPGASWYPPSGEYYTWQKNEHCMVLIGYDAESYVLLDPMKGCAVTYPKDLVALRYRQMGLQALALQP